MGLSGHAFRRWSLRYSITDELQLKVTFSGDGYDTLSVDTLLIPDVIGEPFIQSYRNQFVGEYWFEGTYKRWKYSVKKDSCDDYDSLMSQCYWIDSMEYAERVKLLCQPIECLAESLIDQRLIIDFSRDAKNDFEELLCHNLLQWNDRVLFPIVNNKGIISYPFNEFSSGYFRSAYFQNDSLLLTVGTDYRWYGVKCKVIGVRMKSQGL